MSSNNQLVILKKGKWFEVHHNLCVDNDFHPSKNNLLAKEKTLVEAIKYANDYCNEEMVEYGYYVDISSIEEMKGGKKRNGNKK